jgi:hypothetical protein
MAHASYEAVEGISERFFEPSGMASARQRPALEHGPRDLRVIASC